jgi:hypothetical protein
MLRRKRKNKFKAPATLYYTAGPNAQGVRCPCVFAECHYGGARVGPIWGHRDASVRRALAELTRQCGCGRRFHHRKFVEGRPEPDPAA